MPFPWAPVIATLLALAAGGLAFLPEAPGPSPDR